MTLHCSSVAVATFVALPLPPTFAVVKPDVTDVIIQAVPPCPTHRSLSLPVPRLANQVIRRSSVKLKSLFNENDVFSVLHFGKSDQMQTALNLAFGLFDVLLWLLSVKKEMIFLSSFLVSNLFGFVKTRFHILEQIWYIFRSFGERRFLLGWGVFYFNPFPTVPVSLWAWLSIEGQIFLPSTIRCAGRSAISTVECESSYGYRPGETCGRHWQCTSIGRPTRCPPASASRDPYPSCHGDRPTRTWR